MDQSSLNVDVHVFPSKYLVYNVSWSMICIRCQRSERRARVSLVMDHRADMRKSERAVSMGASSEHEPFLEVPCDQGSKKDNNPI